MTLMAIAHLVSWIAFAIFLVSAFLPSKSAQGNGFIMGSGAVAALGAVSGLWGLFALGIILCLGSIHTSLDGGRK